MLDWNLKATWDSEYLSYEGSYGVPGYWRHYEFVHSNGARRRSDFLISRLGLTAASSVAVIGGAFGYLQEELVRRLPGISVATTDVSTWVQAEKGNTETADLQTMIAGLGLDHTVPGSDGERLLNLLDTGLTRAKTTAPAVSILDEDIGNRGSRNQVRGAAGLANNEDFDWVISDDVLSTLTDAEATDLNADMRQLALADNRVVHIISPESKSGGDAGSTDYNIKTLDAWKSLVGVSGVVSVALFEVAA